VRVRGRERVASRETEKRKRNQLLGRRELGAPGDVQGMGRERVHPHAGEKSPFEQSKKKRLMVAQTGKYEKGASRRRENVSVRRKEFGSHGEGASSKKEICVGA